MDTRPPNPDPDRARVVSVTRCQACFCVLNRCSTLYWGTDGFYCGRCVALERIRRQGQTR